MAYRGVCCRSGTGPNDNVVPFLLSRDARGFSKRISGMLGVPEAIWNPYLADSCPLLTTHILPTSSTLSEEKYSDRVAKVVYFYAFEWKSAVYSDVVLLGALIPSSVLWPVRSFPWLQRRK